MKRVSMRTANWSEAKTLTELEWEAREWGENAYPRQVVVADMYPVWVMGGMAGIWMYRDHNPELSGVVDECVTMFKINENTDPQSIYWWKEWTLADPARGLSLLSMQEELTKLPWPLVLWERVEQL